MELTTLFLSIKFEEDSNYFLSSSSDVEGSGVSETGHDTRKRTSMTPKQGKEVSKMKEWDGGEGRGRRRLRIGQAIDNQQLLSMYSELNDM